MFSFLADHATWRKLPKFVWRSQRHPGLLDYRGYNTPAILLKPLTVSESSTILHDELLVGAIIAWPPKGTFIYHSRPSTKLEKPGDTKCDEVQRGANATTVCSLADSFQSMFFSVSILSLSVARYR